MRAFHWLVSAFKEIEADQPHEDHWTNPMKRLFVTFLTHSDI
jgi:hypothetical protein